MTNNEKKLLKIKNWFSTSLGEDCVRDIKAIYGLDEHSFVGLFTDEEIDHLDEAKSDLKIENYKSVFDNQRWMKFRLSVFTAGKMLLISKDLLVKRLMEME